MSDNKVNQDILDKYSKKTEPKGVDNKLIAKHLKQKKNKAETPRFPLPEQKTDIGRILAEFGVGAAQAGGLGYPGKIAEKIQPGAEKILKTPSPLKAERVARGVGTATGFAALLPRLIFQAGAAGAGRLAAGAGRFGQAAAKGAGGLGLLETLKAPEKGIGEKLVTVPVATGLGALGGLGGEALGPIINRYFGADVKAYKNWLKDPKVSPTSKELILSKVDPVNKILKALNQAKVKPISPLVREAKKYKSAEEFVSTQQKTFRGGQPISALKITDKGISVSRRKGTAYAFEQVESRLQRAKGKPEGAIQELFISPKAKIVNIDNVPKNLTDALSKETKGAELNIVRWAKSKGFDVVDFKETTGVDELRIINPVVLKTKSQLTNIWKQAQETLSKEPMLSKVDPVDKIIKSLREAKPVRSEQEALYHEARKKLTAKIAKIGAEVPGEKGFQKQLSALKGELPKIQFKGIRTGVTQGDIDSLFNTIEYSSKILPFEKITAKTGLMKLIGTEGGVVPTKGQINILETVFGSEFTRTVLAKRALLQKFGEGAAEVLNVPRALMASFDMSAPFRQGVFLTGRPKQFAPAFRDMFKFFFSKKAYNNFESELRNRATFPLMKEAGLPLTDMGGGLGMREEAFMSRLAERIPIIGKGVEASDRAYTGFLNKLRADVFDDLVNKATSQGIKMEGSVLRSLGRFIGAATGRGTLPKSLENSAVALNSVLFSPRLIASRVQLMNPVFYAKLDPFVRKEALKSLLSFTGIASSVLGLAKAGGADVGIDPRSADFGKIKVGNTRYDILGGFQQYIRLGAQLITGEHISSTTGVKTVAGEGYNPLTRAEILQRFIENKEAPVASFITSALKGKTPIGEDFELEQEMLNRVTPMVMQDMADLIKERGALEGIGMSLPAFFGTGVQTYSPTAEDMVRAKNSVERSVRELKKQGRDDEALRLYKRNEKQYEIGIKLEPIQKEINKLRKANDDVIKNITILPKEKKKIMSLLDSKKRKLEKWRDRRFLKLK